jgi:predicted DNA-binding transcriptional regulator YafY
VAGTKEIKIWILSFGRHVQVVRPDALREKIKKEAKEIVSS